MSKDWKGCEIVGSEDENKEIFVWEVSPHPHSRDFDYFAVRDYHAMLEAVKESALKQTDESDKNELMEGLKIEIRLTKMTLRDLMEIEEEAE